MGRTLGISLIKIQYLAQALVIKKESPRAVAAGLNKEPVTFRVVSGKGSEGGGANPRPGVTGGLRRILHDAFRAINRSSSYSKEEYNHLG